MDLTTSYLGIQLAHPIVPSASPLSKRLDTIQRMAEAGAPAITMHSLFEEQVTMESRQIDHYLSSNTDSFSEALSYFPEAEDYRVGPHEYLEHIHAARRITGLPIIGSLNGVSVGGWTNYATMIQDAGASALELNIYYIPTDLNMHGEKVEQMYLEVIEEVCQRVSIPVAVKISPYFSSIPNIAMKIKSAGADGLVMFNRFYQPDFDLDTMEVVPNVSLSNSNDMRLPLRWTAILYKKIALDFAITSGVHSHFDVIKGLLAGASITMTAAELLVHGIKRLTEMRDGLEQWLVENEYESVSQLRGAMSQQHVAEPAAFERANYMKVLNSWEVDGFGALLK